MIEILFSDSACGSMKAARRFGSDTYLGGSVGVMISHSDGSEPTQEEIDAAQREAEEQHRLAWENAVPLDGDPADVYGFSLALSVGDISEDQPGAKRQRVLSRLYGMYPKIAGDEVSDEMMLAARETLATLRERMAAGEPMRIWYSNWPEDMCGLYWLCDQLRLWEANDGQVSLVKFPDWESGETEPITRRSSWGEVPPGEWRRYLELQVSASPTFLKSCASHWRTLQKENAPLRAALNGQLVSVPEGIYDSFILREIAEEDNEFREVMVIGRVLGKYRLGVGDGWIALRIEEMIRAGILEAVTSAPEHRPLYDRTLRKCISEPGYTA